jgi:hypothetical protein
LIEGIDRFLKRNCEQSREEERTDTEASELLLVGDFQNLLGREASPTGLFPQNER